MRIYVGHSREFDYVKELYEPLRKSRLNQEHEIILPHEKSDQPFSSKNLMKTINVFIAEVSYAATGLGIELGWADAAGVFIICIYKKGTKPSRSLSTVSNHFIEYSNEEEMIDKIEETLKNSLAISD